jgi:hypothetical protein
MKGNPPMSHYDEDDEQIRDGETVRVPMYCMDSLQRSVAGLSQSRARHQPSFVSDVETAFDQEAALDAQERRDFEKAQLSAAWKGGFQAGDRIRLGDRDMVVDGRNPANGKVRLRDAEDAEALLDAAYAEYDYELTNAWRNDD